VIGCDWHLRQPKVSTHVPFPAVKLKCSQGLDVRSKLQKFDYPFNIILWSSDSARTRCGIVLFAAQKSKKDVFEKPGQARFFPGPNPVAKGVQPEISILNHGGFSPARDF
jgi:hypothetical protein